MTESKAISEHQDGSINYKFIFAIILGITTFHYLINFTQDEDTSEFVLSTFSIINPIATGIAALIVSFHHRFKDLGLKSKSFRFAYIALASAFLAAAGGEVLFFIYDYVLGEPAFPSPADVLFIPFYPLVLAFLYLNTSFCKPTFRLSHLWITILPTIIIVLYLVLLGKHEQDFQFFISLYYIVVSAVSLAFTIFAVLIFRGSLLGKTWMLLLLGIIPFTVADVVYYNLEAMNGYDLVHPVNLLWYTGYWIVTYALYKYPSRKKDGMHNTN